MRYLKLVLCFISFGLSFYSSAQSKRLKLKDFKIQTLSDTLREISGLTELNQSIFAINDSGNSADIFQIKKESPYIQKVLKTNLVNHDWETITNDGTDLYVGDIGNNLGNRKDLKIYKIPLINDSLQLNSIQEIPFYYPEQRDFTPRNLRNNFDAESLTFVGKELNLFTKEWQSRKITRYKINQNLTENQAAEKLEDYQLGYVATDANFYKEKLYVVGYTKATKVFLSIFERDNNGLFFTKKPKKIKLGSALGVGQLESVVALDGGLLLASEAFDYKIGKVKQSLYFVPYEYL